MGKGYHRATQPDSLHWVGCPCDGVPRLLRQPHPEFNTSLWTQHLTSCGKSEYPCRAEQDPGEVTPGPVALTSRESPLAGLVSLPETLWPCFIFLCSCVAPPCPDRLPSDSHPILLF